MHEATAHPEVGAPPLRPVTRAILARALALGWQDLRSAPQFALAFAGAAVLAGWAIAWVTLSSGQSYWLVFAALGFPLVGPFAAVAFYEVSRRRSRGAPLDWAGIASVMLQQSRRQLPSLCAIIVVLFLFWFFLAHMIFALFLGLSTMTNISSSAEVYLSLDGLKMLAVGSIVGAGFALLVYMITVLALPLLLDREVDFVTAMITSFAYVQAHFPLMFGWGLLIAVMTLVAMLPALLGLFLVLPVLGHASWHLYAQLADREGLG